jgi:hypothetical protein
VKETFFEKKKSIFYTGIAMATLQSVVFKILKAQFVVHSYARKKTPLFNVPTPTKRIVDCFSKINDAILNSSAFLNCGQFVGFQNLRLALSLQEKLK